MSITLEAEINGLTTRHIAAEHRTAIELLRIGSVVRLEATRWATGEVRRNATSASAARVSADAVESETGVESAAVTALVAVAESAIVVESVVVMVSAAVAVSAIAVESVVVTVSAAVAVSVIAVELAVAMVPAETAVGSETTAEAWEIAVETAVESATVVAVV